MPAVPTDDIDSYLDSLESLLFATSGSSLFDIDIGGIEEAFNRIWNEIEHGYYDLAPTETIQIQIPSLAELEARFAAEEGLRAATSGSGSSFSFLEKISRWVGSHKCVVLGLIFGLAWLAYKRRRRLGYLTRRVRRRLMKTSESVERKPKPSICK